MVPLSPCEDEEDSRLEAMLGNPKSAMQGRPVSSIRMFALGSGELRAREGKRGLETYPLQIAMNYFRVVDVFQPLRNAHKLQLLCHCQ